MLGMISYDSDSGKIEMNNLMAVLAGGISEAKRYLKTEISFNLSKVRILTGLAGLFFASSAVIAYFKFIRYSHEKQLKQSIEK